MHSFKQMHDIEKVSNGIQAQQQKKIWENPLNE